MFPTYFPTKFDAAMSLFNLTTVSKACVKYDLHLGLAFNLNKKKHRKQHIFSGKCEGNKTWETCLYIIDIDSKISFLGTPFQIAYDDFCMK
jgi:hypothetical protein